MKKFCPNCEEMLKTDSNNPNIGHCKGCGWSGHLSQADREPGLPTKKPKLPYVSIDIETTGLNPETCQTLEIGAVIDDWTLPIDELPVFHRVLSYDEVSGSPFAMSLNANLLKLIGNRPQEDQLDLPVQAVATWMEKCAFPNKDFPQATIRRLLGETPIHWYEIPNVLLMIGRRYDLAEALTLGGNPPGVSCFCRDFELAELFATWIAANGLDPKSVQAAGKNFSSFDMQFLNRLPWFSEHIKFRHRVIDPAILFWNPAEDDRLPDSKTCYERAGYGDTVAHTAVEDAKAVVWLVRQGVKRL
jgi:DNA-directed RNA polymerase subunit M/transcription elongation factor TFIIS